MKALAPWKPFRELEWAPFRELEEWHRQVDDLFSRLFDFPRAAGGRPGELLPALESFTRNGELIVRADLPGLDPKEVDISVVGDVLTIKGERKADKEEKHGEYIRREISYGAFERQMVLPQGVDADKIKAKYEKGVLEISMPAPKELSAKKVAVQVEGRK